MKIYLIVPVRSVTPDVMREAAQYVKRMEDAGHSVHFPPPEP